MWYCTLFNQQKRHYKPMDRINELYNAIKRATPAKLKAAIRTGDISRCFGPEGIPFDCETSRQVIQLGRNMAAAEMVPPYLLSDYLCYMYAQPDEQFASDLGVTVEYVAQAIYDGCYWINGTVCRPELPGDDSVYSFISTGVSFADKKAKCLRADLWSAYVIWTAGNGRARISRLPFHKEVQVQLGARGIALRRSVRVGQKVSTGYVGISVKRV